MKNHIHNLMHGAARKADQTFRIEQHYLKDAEGCPKCTQLWSQIIEDEQKHIKLIEDELKAHYDRGDVD